jgi:hypothetical protein
MTQLVALGLAFRRRLPSRADLYASFAFLSRISALLGKGGRPHLAGCTRWHTRSIAAFELSKFGRTTADWRMLLLTQPAIKRRPNVP